MLVKHHYLRTSVMLVGETGTASNERQHLMYPAILNILCVHATVAAAKVQLTLVFCLAFDLPSLLLARLGNMVGQNVVPCCNNR